MRLRSRALASVPAPRSPSSPSRLLCQPSAWDRPHYSPPPLPAQARKDHAREKRRTRPVCTTRLGSLVCGRVCVCVCLVVCPMGTLPRLRRPPGRRSCRLLRPQTPRTQFPISDVGLTPFLQCPPPRATTHALQGCAPPAGSACASSLAFSLSARFSSLSGADCHVAGAVPGC